uniref:Alpha-amylase n=1 Tax=Cajanus cajan TaxID=3821 RepID=A0A151RBS2_CAJCA|nr:Alpha-amylase [Cajanus cajan]
MIQVELDSLELQADQEQPIERKTVNVKFQLHCTCNFGEQFLVVGNDPLFGSWNPKNAIPMTWSEGHVWTLEMGVPIGKFQFKYILKKREGDIVWQPGPDRIIHTWEAMNKIIVHEDWNNAQLQKVTEDGDESIISEKLNSSESNLE